MAQPFRQESFASGELSDRVSARTSLGKWAAGLRRCHNFLPTPEGPALNRPGLPFVRETKLSGASVSRTIPFIYSEDDGQVFLLEFGELYVQVLELDGTLVQELVTPYAAAELWRLKAVQSGRMVTLTLKGQAPRELWWSGVAWDLRLSDFDVRPVPAGAIPGEPVLLTSSLRSSDDARPAKKWRWGLTVRYRDPETGLALESELVEIERAWNNGAAEWTNTAVYDVGAVVQYLTQTYVARNKNQNAQPDTNLATYDGSIHRWLGAWSSLGPADLGTSARLFVPAPEEVCLWPDRPVVLDWSQDPMGLVLAPTVEVLGFSVYRGRKGLWGWIGDTDAGGTSFQDDGEAPDLSIQPPMGTSPFAAGETPAAVGFFGDRRVFGGAQPERLEASRVGDYSDFDRPTPALADTAMQFGLSGRLRETIRWILGTSRLLVGTQSSVQAIGAVQGDVFGPGTYESAPASSAGSSWLDPLVLPPEVVLYVTAKGGGVRDLVPEGPRYASSDLALLARHLFTGHRIVAWAFAAVPWSVAWLVREDGKLLSLTYVRDQEVWAWAWHDTRGLVEDVCVVPDGTEDVPVLTVKRQLGNGSWHRYHERMATRNVATAAEGVFLDSSVTARGVVAVDGVAAVGGLAHLEGLEVVALVDGQVVRNDPDGEPLVVQAGTVILPAEEDLGVVHVGLPYVSELETLDLEASGANVKHRVKNVVRALVEVEGSRGLQVAESVDAPADEWVEWEQRRVEHGYGAIPLETETAELSTFSSWNKHGRVAVRQVEPLPCTILAVTREAEVGGT